MISNKQIQCNAERTSFAPWSSHCSSGHSHACCMLMLLSYLSLPAAFHRFTLLIMLKTGLQVENVAWQGLKQVHAWTSTKSSRHQRIQRQAHQQEQKQEHWQVKKTSTSTLASTSFNCYLRCHPSTTSTTPNAAPPQPSRGSNSSPTQQQPALTPPPPHTPHHPCTAATPPPRSRVAAPTLLPRSCNTAATQPSRSCTQPSRSPRAAARRPHAALKVPQATPSRA